MKMLTTCKRIALAFLILGLLTALPAQQATTTNPAIRTTLSVVPRLVRVSSSFRPADGQPAAAVEGVTLSIYKDEKGGTPLWQEVQNVTVDSEGHYTVLLGLTHTDGVPAELFSAGEPRWLGVQFQRPGEAEQARVLMASVPYALKAADAETLGGRPASAYLLAPAAGASVSPVANGGTLNLPTADSSSKLVKLQPQDSSGTPGSIGMFTNSTDLGNSVMFQSGSRIGLGTSSPMDFFHVQFNDPSGAFTGYAVQNLGNSATSYSGMLHYDQNGAVVQFQGFNNSTHEYRINNIAKSGANYNGSINFMIGGSSKFLVASNGGIGIGTTAPSQALDVNGNIKVEGSGYGVIFPDGSKIGSGLGVAHSENGVPVTSIMHT